MSKNVNIKKMHKPKEAAVSVFKTETYRVNHYELDHKVFMYNNLEGIEE